MSPEEFKRMRNRERKREERARYRDNGLIALTVHVKPQQKEALLQYVEGLNKKNEY